ncbi:MAG: response regulator [Candidatus Latescibacteria bacterium]|nr:response regulator [Candidatus Latescibacterota bacterium]
MQDMASILVVDDEESVRRVISRLLASQGYRVSSAGCVDDAIEIMGREEFDILLTDHLMKGGTGLDLIVETNKLYPNTVKLLLTGFGDRNLYLEAINKGAVFSVIEKPPEPKQLLEKIARAVEYRHKRRLEKIEFEKLKEEHHSLFANTTDLILCVDSEGRFIYVNPAWHNILGYGDADLERVTLIDCLREDYRDYFYTLIEVLQDGAAVKPFETVMVTSDGRDVFFEGNVMSAYVERAIMTVTFMMRDVTERKRATEEIQARLRQETMIARITELIARADEPSMVYRDIIEIIGGDVGSDRAYLYGLDEENGMLDLVSFWKSPSVPDGIACRESIPCDAAPDFFRKVARGETVACSSPGDLDDTSASFFRSVGVKSLLVFPLGIGGGVAGLLGFDTLNAAREWDEKEVNMLKAASNIIANAWDRQVEIDVRKEKEAEAEESRLLVIRADRLAALGTMSAGIIHEITQPLNAINVSAQTILYGLKHGWTLEQEQVERSLHLINSQISRMSDIITNMRAFAREGLPAYREMTNLNAQVERVFTLMGEQMKAHDIALDMNLGDVPSTEMNTNLIFQVIVNLVTNARQALDEFDRSDKRIIIATHADDENVYLEVADNGPGIPAGLSEKIFDPFFTTKEVGKGTGLGLSISAGIVHDHKGALICRNSEGGGAAFVMSLPIVDTLTETNE